GVGLGSTGLANLSEIALIESKDFAHAPFVGGRDFGFAVGRPLLEPSLTRSSSAARPWLSWAISLNAFAISPPTPGDLSGRRFEKSPFLSATSASRMTLWST